MRFEVDAVLFDIDGTLVDSTASVERTWRRWCAAHGVDAEALLAVSHGRRGQDTVAMFLPADQVATAVESLVALEADDMEGVDALPATADLLAALPPQRWAAVTSGGRAVMLARLAAAGLPAPAVLVASEDVSVGKPDPQGYLTAARRLGVDPLRCLVIEDAPAGIAAGRAAGCAVLAVATSHPASALGDADVVVGDLTAVDIAPGPEGLVVTTR